MRKIKAATSSSSSSKQQQQKKFWRLVPCLGIIFVFVISSIGVFSLHNTAMSDIQTNQQGTDHSSFVQPQQANNKEQQQQQTKESETKIILKSVDNTPPLPPPPVTKFKKNETTSSSSFPLATSLINKPPPFQESDILELSPTNMTTSPNTVVTGYFRVASKYKSDSYDGWMSNFLSLQDHMVIFTQPELVEQIKTMRSHAWEKTVIIQMKLDDLPIGTLFPTQFWEKQLNKDPEKRIHKSYQLFWIWLSKSWCVTQAIRLNFFQSDLFVWSDIGCFRNKKYNSKTMIQHRNQVPRYEMMQMAHHPPNPPSEELFNDKYKRKSNFYHSGSQAVAYKDTWNKFHEYFLDIIDRFIAKDMLIVEDQAVLQSVCLTHPEICAYVPFTEVKDNHYFGLRHVLHHGNNPKLWRHPKVANKTTTSTTAHQQN